MSHNNITITCDQHDILVAFVTSCYIILFLFKFKIGGRKKEKRNRKIQVKNRRNFE